MATVRLIDRQIQMHAEALVGLPVERVRGLLLDYPNLPRVITDLKTVRMLAPGDDGAARMQVEASIGIACFSFDSRWTQQIHLHANGDIEAIINPGESDRHAGRAHWRLLPRNGQTLLVFDARLSPNLWFPPGIGALLIQRILEKKAALIARGLERVAAIPRPPSPPER